MSASSKKRGTEFFHSVPFLLFYWIFGVAVACFPFRFSGVFYMKFLFFYIKTDGFYIKVNYFYINLKEFYKKYICYQNPHGNQLSFFKKKLAHTKRDDEIKGGLLFDDHKAWVCGDERAPAELLAFADYDLQTIFRH
jgi:hypothetical protein